MLALLFSLASSLDPGLNRYVWAAVLVLGGVVFGWIGGRLLGAIIRMVVLAVAVLMAWGLIHGGA